MKLSTVFKAVVAVAAVCTAGSIAYKAIKKNDNSIDVEPATIDELDDTDDETECASSGITPKQVAVAVVAGGACVLFAVPFVTQMMYKSSVYSLTQKAIDNGNLTFEELMRLANNTSQEVA